MMWVLLNKVMWPCSSASVWWCYGDPGLEVPNSYVVIACFKVKLLHSSDSSVSILYKIVLFDLCIKSDFSFFFLDCFY